MRRKISKSLITYAVLLFYLCTPVLDSMVCADCAGHVPFQGESTISHMKAAHIDVSYSPEGGTSSDTAPERGHKAFCSICANVLMGAVVSAVKPPVLLVQRNFPRAMPTISELHYSIDKPPQNSLV